MRSAPPLVTVAMPVRNAMPYLPSALESVLGQTYGHLDVVVVDDGSTDDSRRYLSQLHDPRVRLLSSGGRGLVAALNLALAEARGELIARQDGDDLSAADRIATQVRYLTDHAAIDVVACRSDFADEDGRLLISPQTIERTRLQCEAARPGRLHELLPLTCCVVHGSVLARRQALLDAGGYRAVHPWAEDYDLWLRLLPRHRLAMLDAVLYTHRIHAGQVSGRRRREQLDSTLRAKLEHLRTVVPRLPAPARTLILGRSDGAVRYASLCREYALDPINAGDESADLMIVADYTDSGGRIHDIAPPPGWWACGNFLVRETWC